MTTATQNLDMLRKCAFGEALTAYRDVMGKGGVLADDFATQASPDLLAVARKLGVSVDVVRFPDNIEDVAAGLILPKLGRIYLNSSLGVAEQTEALSHELAHAVMDMEIAKTSPEVNEGDAMMHITKELPERLSAAERQQFTSLRDTLAEFRADAFGRLLLLPTKTMEYFRENATEWTDLKIAEAIGVTVGFVRLRWADPDLAS